MSRKKGQTCTAKQKTKVVLELLKEQKTINQLATELNVTSKTIQNWKKQFLENADKAFEADDDREAKKELARLQEENDALAKTLGRTTVERDWQWESSCLAKQRLSLRKSLDLSNKKILVDSKLTITKTKQCELIGISRSILYYRPRVLSDINLQILHKMDEIYTDNSEYGYRMTHQELREEGFSIGKDRALKYMGILGIQALYPTKKRLSSLKHLEHKISNAMDATLATNVLQEALSIYPKPKIFNSDQGNNTQAMNICKY